MRRLRPFILIGVALLAWEILARSGLWSPLLFPSLASIGRELGRFASGTDGLLEAWISLARPLGGFALPPALGAPIGILLARPASPPPLPQPLSLLPYS